MGTTTLLKVSARFPAWAALDQRPGYIRQLNPLRFARVVSFSFFFFFSLQPKISQTKISPRGRVLRLSVLFGSVAGSLATPPLGIPDPESNGFPPLHCMDT